MGDDHGAGVNHSVSISKALPLIASAKEKIKAMEPPSAELLPDFSKIPFPISQLLMDEAKQLPNRISPYHIESSFFSIDIKTPPLGYKFMKKSDEFLLKRRMGRAKRKGFELSDDEFEHKNTIKFYDYKKPVVRVTVVPKPKLTAGSKVLNTVAFVAATGVTAASFGAGAPLMAIPFYMGRKEFKKDFLKLTLQTADQSAICHPVLSGRQPYTAAYALYTQYSYKELIDKSYVGVYEFDSKCFETTKPMAFILETEGEKKNLSVTLPERIKNSVVSDFKPYWEHVLELNKTTPSPTQVTQPTWIQEVKIQDNKTTEQKATPIAPPPIDSPPVEAPPKQNTNILKRDDNAL
jgi:hypothetical protein